MHFFRDTVWVACFMVSISLTWPINAQENEPPTIGEVQTLLAKTKVDVSSERIQNEITKIQNVVSGLLFFRPDITPSLNESAPTTTSAQLRALLESLEISVPIKKGKIRFGPVKLRENNKINAEEVALLKKDDTVEIILELDQWYRVITEDNKSGYIFADFIEIITDTQPFAPSSDNVAPSERGEYVRILRESAARDQGSAASRPRSLEELSEAVDEMAGTIEKEDASFKTAAFKCREELEVCRPKYGALDCDLTMIVCLVGVLTGG